MQPMELTIEKEAPQAPIEYRKVGMVHFLKEVGGLNPNFLAKITPFPVEKDKPTMVVGILEDAEFSLENQYATPFEHSNPEGRMPNLMGMIQSGQITASVYDIIQASNNPTSYIGKALNTTMDSVETILNATGMTEAANQTIENVQSTLAGLEGRTSFTKINSQQIFTSSNSIRITGTLIFSAWADAKTEVEEAIQKLQEWTVPRFLADTSISASIVQHGVITGLFPSEIPHQVNLEYGGKTYRNLVIESLSAPITAPMNAHGNRITVKCQITLLSLKAWDKADVTKLYS